MKKTLVLGIGLTLSAISFTACDTLENLTGVLGTEDSSSTTKALTNQEVIAGLKEALTVGTNNSAGLASKLDGFNANPKIRLPFPEDALKVKEKALELGLSSQVEKFELTLNRAAEEASKEAAPIFVNAVKNMTVADGFSILKGENNAATKYLEDKTSTQLRTAFAPKVESAIETVELTKYWEPLAKKYNLAVKFTGGDPVNTDLTDYVTTKAMGGLFTLISEEEGKIRENPAARVSDLLKRVFGSVLK